MEAVEVMMASGNEPISKNGARNSKYPKDLAQQRDRQRENNPSRLDKIVDEPVI